jgi:hypothetical protein
MTSTDPTLLSVRCTADLLAAVPYLLGFHPADSVVVVAVSGRRVVFAARGDLPGWPPDRATTTDDVAAYLADVTGRQGADGALVVGYGPPARVTPVLDAVGVAVGRAGVRVLDLLRVTDGRYWSYVCDEPGCCPPEGTPFDASTSQVTTAAVYAGHVALPDRDALTRQVAPVGGAAREEMTRATRRAGQRLERLLDAAPPDSPYADQAVRSAGGAALRAAYDRHRAGGRLTDDEVAWLGLLLTLRPVLDHAWETVDTADGRVTFWAELVRRVDPAHAATPASLLAFAAWRLGQGALAVVAVERALATDPGHRMARLVDDLLRRGINPAALDPVALDPAALDPAALDPAALDPAALDPAGLDPAGLDERPGAV